MAWVLVPRIQDFWQEHKSLLLVRKNEKSWYSWPMWNVTFGLWSCSFFPESTCILRNSFWASWTFGQMLQNLLIGCWHSFKWIVLPWWTMRLLVVLTGITFLGNWVMDICAFGRSDNVQKLWINTGLVNHLSHGTVCFIFIQI